MSLFSGAIHREITFQVKPAVPMETGACPAVSLLGQGRPALCFLPRPPLPRRAPPLRNQKKKKKISRMRETSARFDLRRRDRKRRVR